MSKDKQDLILISNDIREPINLRIYLDQEYCKDKADIRFIEWNFITADYSQDLGINIVGEVGEMHASLTRQILHKLPTEEAVKLVVSTKIAMRDNSRGSQDSITDISDDIKLKMLSSPIKIILTGHNTGYGSDETILIDASDTYDSDIEGIPYYLPFTFKWMCPKEIPKYACENKMPVAGRSYALSLYTKELIRYGLKFNEYYEFKAVASRDKKESTKSFWLKVINEETVPKITISEANRGVKYIHLLANVEHSAKISNIKWSIEAGSGERQEIKGDYFEEVIISKVMLKELNVTRVYATLIVNNSSSGVSNSTYEGFYEVTLEFPTHTKPNEILPSFKIEELAKSVHYSVLSIDIIDYTESYSEPVDQFKVHNLMYVDSDGETTYISENSLAKSVYKHFVNDKATLIIGEIWIYHSMDCIFINGTIEKHKSSTTPTSQTFADMLEMFVNVQDYQANNGYAQVLLKGLVDNTEHDANFVMNTAKLLKKLELILSQSGHFESLQILSKYSEVFNFMLMPNNQHMFNDYVFKSSGSEPLLATIVRVLDEDLLTRLLNDTDIENHDVLSAVTEMLSTLILQKEYNYGSLSHQTELIGTIVQIFKNLQASTTFSRLYSQPFNASTAILTIYIHPFYPSIYSPKTSVNITLSTALDYTYYINIKLSQFTNPKQQKWIFSVVLLDDILSSDPDIIKIVSLSVNQTVESQLHIVKFQNISLAIPLADLGFNFKSEMAPIEIYECVVHQSRASVVHWLQGLVDEDDPWQKDECSKDYNSTHLQWEWYGATLIAVKKVYTNITVLKLFFLGFIAFMGISLYFCTMMWASGIQNESALRKLSRVAHHDTQTWWGRFKLLFKTLHLFYWWKNNPATSYKKSLTFLVFSILMLFIYGTIVGSYFRIIDVENQRYIKYESKVTFNNFMVFGTLFLFIWYETLKCLFIKSIHSSGMVKLTDISAQSGALPGSSRHPGEELKEEDTDVDTSKAARKEELKQAKELISSITRQQPATINSSARDPQTMLSSQRQLQPGSNTSGLQHSVSIPLGQIQEEPEEVVIDESMLEVSTGYQKWKLIWGIALLVSLVLVGILYMSLQIDKVNVYASFKALLYTCCSTTLYIFIVHPLYIAIASCFMSDGGLSGIISWLIVTEEAKLIYQRCAKIRALIEKEKRELAQSQMRIEEEQKAPYLMPRKKHRGGNTLDSHRHSANQDQSEQYGGGSSRVGADSHNLDMTDDGLQRRKGRQRHPTQVNIQNPARNQGQQ